MYSHVGLGRGSDSSTYAPCSPYVNQRFGGTYHLHLQGRKSAEQETSIRWLDTARLHAGFFLC
jgi:hypothetical protein